MPKPWPNLKLILPFHHKLFAVFVWLFVCCLFHYHTWIAKRFFVIKKPVTAAGSAIPPVFLNKLTVVNLFLCLLVEVVAASAVIFAAVALQTIPVV